jgi:hypothetical protein
MQETDCSKRSSCCLNTKSSKNSLVTYAKRHRTNVNMVISTFDCLNKKPSFSTKLG